MTEERVDKPKEDFIGIQTSPDGDFEILDVIYYEDSFKKDKPWLCKRRSDGVYVHPNNIPFSAETLGRLAEIGAIGD